MIFKFPFILFKLFSRHCVQHLLVNFKLFFFWLDRVCEESPVEGCAEDIFAILIEINDGIKREDHVFLTLAILKDIRKFGEEDVAKES